jgi:PAS domain S-box-containing protein
VLPAFSDLSLRQKGLVLVSVPVVTLLALLVNLITVERQARQADDWVRHTFEVRQNLQLDLTLLVDAETGTRGYLLTGRDNWLEPYRNAVIELPPSIDALAVLVRDDRAQDENVRRLRQAVDERLRALGALQIHAAPIQQGELRAELFRSKASMDRARDLFQQLQPWQASILAARTRQAQQVRQWLAYLFLAVMVAGIGGGLLAAWLFGRHVARRVKQLTEAAAALSARRPLPPVDPAKDEIGRLSGVLHETDRMLADRERQLQEARSFLEHLVDTSPTVIFRQDPQTLQVTYVSPNVERVLGYTPAEILAEPDFWLSHIHPEDHPNVVEQDQRALAGRTRQMEIESRFRRKDGTYRWLDSFVHIEYDTAGRPLEFLGHRLDITERKIAEEALRDREANLDATNKELEAFSYSVSHDLRAPLRSIDGFSQALVEDYASQLDSSAKDYLRRVRNATQRMAELIDDLLNLSRVTLGPLRREQVSLSTVAQAVAHDLRQTQPGRVAEFAIETRLEDYCDQNLIRVVLENLLGNSWKFTSKHPTARIEFGRSGGAYFVKDDGAGFDAAYKTKLFGAFQRLHHVDDFPGTGIGLATVQRIVRRRGGQVWADGAPEKGATFFFTLK